MFCINSTKRKEVEKGDELLSLGKYRQFSNIKRGNEKEISKKVNSRVKQNKRKLENNTSSRLIILYYSRG